MSLDARLSRLEQLLTGPPELEHCGTCGEPRSWALHWKLGTCPRCLDCGGVIVFAGSPAKRPPPPVSPLIQALTCEQCGEPGVTAYYVGQPRWCAACWQDEGAYGP